jgi:site-specific recombinase XerD
MPSVKFYLINKREEMASIEMRMSYGAAKPLQMSTGERIPVKHWNYKKYRVKSNREFKQYRAINQKLENFEICAIQAFRELESKKKLITKAQLKNAIRQKLKGWAPGKASGEISFVKWADAYVENRLKAGFIVASSAKVYKNTTRFLSEYEKRNRHVLGFRDVTPEMINEFISMLVKKGYAQNYIHKQVKNIRMFMDMAKIDGLHQMEAYRNKNLSVAEELVDAPYLTIDELQIIYDLKTKPGGRLDKIKDLILFESWTGLRHSDSGQVLPHDIRKIKGGKAIFIAPQKGKDRILIPIGPVVEEILVKYNWKSPPNMSNQKTNNYLKELCKLAQIDSPFTSYRTQGGKRVKRHGPKWKFISTHTGRRSFCTNAVKMGCNQLFVMKISGHKTESSFLKYIKITKEEIAQIMIGNEFFQYSLNKKAR